MPIINIITSVSYPAPTERSIHQWIKDTKTTCLSVQNGKIF